MLDLDLGQEAMLRGLEGRSGQEQGDKDRGIDDEVMHEDVHAASICSVAFHHDAYSMLPNAPCRQS